ncbi:cell division protein FtsI/penicillin-binding protein 2 [Bacillus oleivorans]|uniref:Cell division protein FtsI/penicillin-binding protein 2 n=1 Tax=Bacillus oleivorans TaxID=1448271 RepID=A0A285CW19_9BACI|nr:penicillin-binding transpeptidase domain-containing protein [Bacillus oleivorans]SNX71734.1 cell division protein FtsI/penicillin-binding protein 2 [Bacillus oleivorans]
MFGKKRIYVLISAILLLFIILLGRMAQIQLTNTESFTDRNINLLEASVDQRTQAVVIDQGRGKFLDRNGELLTHFSLPSLVLFPFLKEMEWDAKAVASIIGVSEEALLHAIKEAKEPFIFGGSDPFELTENQMKRINELQIPGVFAVHKQFTRKEIPAEQLIGIVRENPVVLKERYGDRDLPINTMIGITGLQASFDEFILQEGETKLLYHVDARGGPLFGIDVKYIDPANPFYPVNVQTTIDIEIQQMIEALTDRHNIQNGGVVLLDVETNDILAMVSRPHLNENAPFDDEGSINFMLTPQIIGSVFKTVVAAAAIDLEMDLPTNTFNCSLTIRDEVDPNYNYGYLNLEESFAKSCNRTFALLAEEIQKQDPALLEKYAEKLSLTGINGWIGDVFHYSNFQQLPDEKAGRVFNKDEDRKDSNLVRLTGIGQHEVRATPLGVASMMATIARGGDRLMTRAVSDLTYKNNTNFFEFPVQKQDGDTISPYTAMKLQHLLREVVVHNEGTGRWFQGLPYEVAGKSGTAETGIEQNGIQLHNKWFAGYFPFKNPAYALVVVNLDVPSEEGGINPLFSDIVKGLYDLDQRRYQDMTAGKEAE